jgi:hypothetical protein
MYKGKLGLAVDGKGFMGGREFIRKDTIESYEVVSETSQKSMKSGIVKGAIGGALFGGVGAIAGAASGKNKGTHTVLIVFKRKGRKCLCELDDDMYKKFLIAVM